MYNEQCKNQYKYSIQNQYPGSGIGTMSSAKISTNNQYKTHTLGGL